MSERLGPAPQQQAYADWQRLDTRTLLVEPVKALRRVGVPAIAAVAGLSASGVIPLPVMVLVAVAGTVLVGALTWLTTDYRLTPTHLEVRRGVLSRTTVTARLDRVRAVELESNVLHRALGLTVVSVGTGVDDSQIQLDALSVPDADRMRRLLLHGAAVEAGATDRPDAAPAAGGPTELVRLSWSWVRFAPINLRNLAAAVAGLAALGGLLQDVLPNLGVHADEHGVNGISWREIGDLALVVALVAVVALPLLWVVLACAGYAVRWGGLRISREQGKEGTVLRRTYGLLTQHSSTVEEAKVRGAVVTTPWLIGLAGGANLSLLTTGLADNQPDLLPSAPRAVITRLADDVLGGPEALAAPLTGHGPRTLRRYRFRAVRGALWWTLLSVVLVLALGGLTGVRPWWLPPVVLVVAVAAGLALAQRRHRRLGHALTGGHVVSQTGGLTVRRTALQTEGIIGWRVRRTFFDRRAGLAQLTATTAAGHEYVDIPDVPVGDAIGLAAQATPTMLADFLEPGPVAQRN